MPMLTPKYAMIAKVPIYYAPMNVLRTLAQTQHMKQVKAGSCISQSLQRAKYFCMSSIGPDAAAA